MQYKLRPDFDIMKFTWIFTFLASFRLFSASMDVFGEKLRWYSSYPCDVFIFVSYFLISNGIFVNSRFMPWYHSRELTIRMFIMYQ